MHAERIRIAVLLVLTVGAISCMRQPDEGVDDLAGRTGPSCSLSPQDEGGLCEEDAESVVRALTLSCSACGVLQAGQACCLDGGQPVPYDTATSCCTSVGIQPKNPIQNLAACPNRVQNVHPVVLSGCSIQVPLAISIGALFTGLFGSAGSIALILQSYAGTFRDVCNAHDTCYATCRSDRGTCDSGFLTAARNRCQQLPGNARQRCNAAALAYYSGIRLGGQNYWVDAQKEHCDCCPGDQPCCSTNTSCTATGANCGSIPDGCGGSLNCGSCTAPQTCGGAGLPNVCGCTPTTCSAAGAGCGPIADGCGGSLDCGTCVAPQTCGGAGLANQCGCTPTTCSAAGAGCGPIADGCGGSLDCGTCVAPQTCGGAGLANQCGCTPTTCSAAGAGCGPIADGCGGSIDCGSCTAPETCGGGGVPNQCGGMPGHIDCGGPLAMDPGGSMGCGLPGPHIVDRINISVGCNDGETASFTVTFDDGFSTSVGAGCGSSFSPGPHLTTNVTITMNSGGGGDNHISFTCCGSSGLSIDYH